MRELEQLIKSTAVPRPSRVEAGTSSRVLVTSEKPVDGGFFFVLCNAFRGIFVALESTPYFEPLSSRLQGVNLEPTPAYESA